MLDIAPSRFYVGFNQELSYRRGWHSTVDYDEWSDYKHGMIIDASEVYLRSGLRLLLGVF